MLSSPPYSGCSKPPSAEMANPLSRMTITQHSCGVRYFLVVLLIVWVVLNLLYIMYIYYIYNLS